MANVPGDSFPNRRYRCRTVFSISHARPGQVDQMELVLGKCLPKASREAAPVGVFPSQTPQQNPVHTIVPIDGCQGRLDR